MSGGPGGGTPDCAGRDLSQDFLEPATAAGEFDSIYHTNDSVSTTWWWGKAGEILATSQEGIVSLLIQNSSRTHSGLDKYYTTLLDHQSISYNHSAGPCLWHMLDVCGNTVMTCNWTIPSSITTDSYGNAYNKFNLIARNDSSENASYIFSPGFLILPIGSSSTAISTSTLAFASVPTSITTSSSTPTQLLPIATTPTVPTTSPTGLSTGAKAGISVGSVLAGVLLIVGAIFLVKMQRQRNDRRKIVHQSTGYNKPELEGKAAEKSIVEVDGAERQELHGRQIDRSPVEMPTE